ncbi:hypothetical protein [Streptomyces sp. BH105]|uniref:hypothetical protein n=1 Tax=Streptomyces sp. BH105 TaxID=3410408 RepID=UPI003CF7FFBE
MALTAMGSDVYAAIITHAQDPQGAGRVRLRIPQVSGDSVTGWAHPSGQVTRRAGVGERVWAAFDGGGSRLIYWSAEPGLITGAQLAEGAIDGMTVSAANPLRSSDPWTDPVMAAGWATTTNFGGIANALPIRYRRDNSGSLHLCGALTVTDASAAATAFSVPEGFYNPAGVVGFTVIETAADGTITTGWGYVGSTGNVHIDKPAGFTRNPGDCFYVNARIHLSE